MNTQPSDANKADGNSREDSARISDQDFTGERRDEAKNTTDQPGAGSIPNDASQSAEEAELGHS